MDTLTAATMQAEYRACVYILVAFRAVVLAMLTAGVILAQQFFGRYPIIMLTGGWTNGNRNHRNSINRRNGDRSV